MSVSQTLTRNPPAHPTPHHRQSSRHWLRRARLWRMILLQDPSGFWDATPGLALSVQARTVRPDPHVTVPKRPTVLPAFLGAVRRVVAGNAAAKRSGGGDKGGELAAAVDGVAERQCPFTGFDFEALEWSMPKELARLDGLVPEEEAQGRHRHGPVNALRIWTTQLCVAALLAMDESWLVDASSDQFDNPTIVDVAMEWLERQARRSPAVAEVLDGSLKQAEDTVALWAHHEALSADATRRAERRDNPWLTVNEATRLAGQLFRSLTRDHETVAAFLSDPADPLKRYQRAVVLFTAVLIGFTTNVWLYWNRSSRQAAATPYCRIMPPAACLLFCSCGRCHRERRPTRCPRQVLRGGARDAQVRPGGLHGPVPRVRGRLRECVPRPDPPHTPARPPRSSLRLRSWLCHSSLSASLDRQTAPLPTPPSLRPPVPVRGAPGPGPGGLAVHAVPSRHASRQHRLQPPPRRPHAPDQARGDADDGARQRGGVPGPGAGGTQRYPHSRAGTVASRQQHWDREYTITR